MIGRQHESFVGIIDREFVKQIDREAERQRGSPLARAVE